MPSNLLYHRRKILGVCVNCGDRPAQPLVLQCALCAVWSRHLQAQWAATHPERVAAKAARFREAHTSRTGPNLLACCGRFHPITTLPLTVACCGTVWFQEDHA